MKKFYVFNQDGSLKPVDDVKFVSFDNGNKTVAVVYDSKADGVDQIRMYHTSWIKEVDEDVQS